MKIVKKILLALVSIIAILLLVALFTAKEYAVVRTTTINKTPAEVYDYVKYLKNQDYYSVWVQRDPNVKKEYRGTDATVGFVSAWESKMDEVGKGEQEITKMEPNARIDYELRFMEPFEAKDNAYMTFESEGDNATKVSWGFNGKMPYPMNLMLLFMDMDGMLGKDLQQGLDNLKGVLEK